MRFFDLHCDTAGECFKTGSALRSNSLHVSLERARCIEKYTQVFAIWLDDVLTGEDAVSYFYSAAECFNKELEANSAEISPYPGDSPVNAILSAEGGSAVGSDISGLERLYDSGVRLMTLTWNGNNAIAGGAFSSGGLTQFGKQVVKRMNALGMVVDVSHLNRDSFWETAAATDYPFIASHSNLDISDNFAAHARNLTSEQAKEIIARDGLIGINFCRDFIETKTERGFEAVYRQIYELSLLGGEKCTAFGSDFDGCEMAEELAGIEKTIQLYSYLLSRDIPRETLDGIFFGNADRFFSQRFK